MKNWNGKTKVQNLIINLNDSFIDNLQPSSLYVLKIPVLPYLDKPKVQVVIKDKIAGSNYLLR